MSIEKRLSSLSSSKDIFEETAPYYEKYLSNCRTEKAELSWSNISKFNYKKEITKEHSMV